MKDRWSCRMILHVIALRGWYCFGCGGGLYVAAFFGCGGCGVGVGGGVAVICSLYFNEEWWRGRPRVCMSSLGPMSPPGESVRTMGRESSIRRCITAYTDIKANESGLYWLLYWLSKYETAKARRALHCKINCVVCINIWFLSTSRGDFGGLFAQICPQDLLTLWKKIALVAKCRLMP